MSTPKKKQKILVTIPGETPRVGIVKLGGKSVQHLSININLLELESFPENWNEERISVKDQNGSSLTLLKCHGYRNTVYPRLIIQGEIGEENITCIRVRMNVASDWFNEFNHFTFNREGGNVINFQFHDNNISASIQENGVRFKISATYGYSTSKNGSKNKIKEWIEFEFRREDGSFGIDDLHEKPVALVNFFSTLLGCAINIDHLSMDTESKKCIPFHYPFSRTKVKKKKSRSDHLILPGWIDEKWEEFFKKYFESPYKESLWARLSGMRKHKGFFEFDFLGYISILDQHVTKVSDGLGYKKISGSQNRKVTSLLNKLNGICASDGQEIIDKIRENLKWEKDIDFPGKYNIALENSNQDIINIINISKEEFKEIKRYRDKIAHGETVKFENNDITKLIKLQSKVKLLLTYFAYKDIGAEDVFKSALSRWINPDVRAAEINSKLLAIQNGSAIAIKLKNDDCSDVRKNSVMTVLLNKHGTDEYKLSKKCSAHMLKPDAKLDDYIASLGFSNFKIEMNKPIIYCEFEEGDIELHCPKIVIFNSPDYEKCLSVIG